MRWRKLILIGVFFECVAGAAVLAAPIWVTPNPCPAPAEAPPFVLEANVAAPEAGARLKVEKSVVVLYDAPLSGGRAGAGLFARLALDSETGLPFDAKSGDGCARQPRTAQ